jgi:hypothetical protein
MRRESRRRLSKSVATDGLETGGGPAPRSSSAGNPEDMAGVGHGPASQLAAPSSRAAAASTIPGVLPAETRSRWTGRNDAARRRRRLAAAPRQRSCARHRRGDPLDATQSVAEEDTATDVHARADTGAGLSNGGAGAPVFARSETETFKLSYAHVCVRGRVFGALHPATVGHGPDVSGHGSAVASRSVGWPGASQPPAPSDPGVTVSRHRALLISRRSG